MPEVYGQIIPIHNVPRPVVIAPPECIKTDCVYEGYAAACRMAFVLSSAGNRPRFIAVVCQGPKDSLEIAFDADPDDEYSHCQAEAIDIGILVDDQTVLVKEDDPRHRDFLDRLHERTEDLKMKIAEDETSFPEELIGPLLRTPASSASVRGLVLRYGITIDYPGMDEEYPESPAGNLGS